MQCDLKARSFHDLLKHVLEGNEVYILFKYFCEFTGTDAELFQKNEHEFSYSCGRSPSILLVLQ